MIVAELIKEVPFEKVKRELLITDLKFKTVLPQIERYFQTLQEVELLLETDANKIQVSREYFDTSYVVGLKKKDVVEELTTFLPVGLILASEVAEEDLVDLDKALILSGVINLLTCNGTCFTEMERQRNVERLKRHMEELKEEIHA